MGHASGLRVNVDVAALRAVADHFDSVAQSVARVAGAQLRFGGAMAGRAHAADGEALRRTLDLLSVAGSSIYKRVIPLVIGVVVIGAVIAWAIARR